MIEFSLTEAREFVPLSGKLANSGCGFQNQDAIVNSSRFHVGPTLLSISSNLSLLVCLEVILALNP
jgi:hypothetical protein